jgi:phospholipase C
VIWILMENKATQQVIGSGAAPYVNALAAACGRATNYSAVTHPSLPNYIALASGDPQGVTDDKPPAFHPLAADSIFSQVKAAGLSWRSYQESAPANCTLVTTGLYLPRHDPATYFTPIRSDCTNWDVPMGSTIAGNFLSDLNTNTLPSFSFVTPNACNDMHDCPVAVGDNWLRTWLPMIIASPGYKAGTTAIFVTWDEDDGNNGNQVPTLVISPSTTAGFQSATAYTHYSLLRTTEEMFGLTAFLGNAATATSMRAEFNLG